MLGIILHLLLESLHCTLSTDVDQFFFITNILLLLYITMSMLYLEVV